MAELKSIRVIFTPRADDALSDIIKKFNLEEYKASIKIDFISKSFAREDVSEKQMSDYLQKELGISSQTAGQISKEIINNIIPLLLKAPGDKFNDPDFREEISKKVFGEEKKPISVSGQKEKKDIDIFPKIKPPLSVAEISKKTIHEKEPIDKIAPLPKKREKIKKLITEEPKQKPRQPKGPDRYREPIG